MKQNEDKPLVVVLNEAKNMVIKNVNAIMHQYKLPCYLMELILTDVYAQVKEGARNELDAEKSKMNSEVESVTN